MGEKTAATNRTSLHQWRNDTWKRQISGQEVPHTFLKQWKQKLHQFSELTIENKEEERIKASYCGRDNAAAVGKADSSVYWNETGEKGGLL